MKQIIKTLQKSRKNNVSFVSRSLFYCVFVFFLCDTNVAFGRHTDGHNVNCYDHYVGTTTAGISGSVFYNKRVFQVDTGVASGFLYCGTSSACRASDGYIGGNFEWCRLTDRGSGSDFASSAYTFANKCNSGCYHIEQMDCSVSGVGMYHCVKSKRRCRYVSTDANDDRFKWAYIFDGSNILAKLYGEQVSQLPANTPNSVEVYGKTFTNDNIAADTYAYYGLDDAYQYGVASGGDQYIYAWDTSRCKFGDVTDHRYYGNKWNCDKGKITWYANKESGGSSAYGFYLAFDKSDAKYTCETCKCGYKKNQTSSSETPFSNVNGRGKCDSCYGGRDYNNNCQCKYGYIAPIGADACTRECTACKPNYTWDPSEVSGSSDTDRICRCRSGFKPSGSAPNDTCGGSDGKQCKPNFRYVAADAPGNDSGYAKCVCDEEYFTWDKGDTGDPEDDKCVLKAGEGGTRYMDRAGEFYLSNDYFHNDSNAGCRFADSSSYPYMIDEQPSDQCSLHDSQDSSSNRCYMNNWWIGLNWSSQQ